MTRRAARVATRERGASRLGLMAYSDPIAMVGIGLSIVVSAVLDLTGLASGPESLLAALMGTTLSLVLDSIVRSERRFRLRGALEAAPWFSGKIFPIADRVTEIVREYPESLVVSEAIQKFEQLHDELDELRRGRIVRGRNDATYLMAAVGSCQTTMVAATNFVAHRPGEGGLDWWASDIGLHYWQANIEAMRRGVRITRIFTYAEMTTELESLVSQQRDAGVRLGLLRRGLVDPALHLNFVVFDGAGAWEARMNAHGEIAANIFTVNAFDIGRIRSAFDLCVISADFSDHAKDHAVAREEELGGV
jgi:hypothetical protein